MTTFCYLFEHRNKELQRTDLYDIVPKKSCKLCHGTGLYGWRIVIVKKHDKDGPRVAVLCGCLRKEEDKLRKSLEGNGHK